MNTRILAYKHYKKGQHTSLRNKSIVKVYKLRNPNLGFRKPTIDTLKSLKG